MKAKELYEGIKRAVDARGSMSFDDAIIVIRYTCHADDADYVATVTANDSIDNDPQFDHDVDVGITLTFDDFETIGHIERIDPSGRIALRGDSKFAPMTFAEFLLQLGNVKPETEMTISVPGNPDMRFSQFDETEIRAGRDSNMPAANGTGHVIYLDADGDFAATEGDVETWAEEYREDVNEIAFDKLAAGDDRYDRYD